MDRAKREAERARKQALYDAAITSRPPDPPPHRHFDDLCERYALGDDVREKLVANFVLKYGGKPDRTGADNHGPMKVDLDELLVAAVLYGRATARSAGGAELPAIGKSAPQGQQTPAMGISSDGDEDGNG